MAVVNHDLMDKRDKRIKDLEELLGATRKDLAEERRTVNEHRTNVADKQCEINTLYDECRVLKQHKENLNNTIEELLSNIGRMRREFRNIQMLLRAANLLGDRGISLGKQTSRALIGKVLSYVAKGLYDSEDDDLQKGEVTDDVLKVGEASREDEQE